MFDRFGEFDSVEELNRAAKAQRDEGDELALVSIAKENGIDVEDAEDFMDGAVEVFATPLMAATGKLKIEAEDIKLGGILTDWKDEILSMCMENEEMCMAVRKKEKSLIGCMAKLIQFAFENKVQVNEKIVKATKVHNNGNLQAMRGPLYLGIPNKTEMKKLIKEYYLG